MRGGCIYCKCLPKRCVIQMLFSILSQISAEYACASLGGWHSVPGLSAVARKPARS